MRPDDVRRIAALARLRLTDEEVTRIAAQFVDILAHLERLRGVPTEGVEPLDHPLPIENVLREDVPRPGLTREAAMAGAPDVDQGRFRVPRILGE